MRQDDQGNVEFLHSDPNVNAILDNNKAMFTHNDGYSKSKDIQRIARIPLGVAYKWLNEEGWWYQDPEAKDKFLAKLDDPEWSYLRTGGKRVGKQQRMI